MEIEPKEYGIVAPTTIIYSEGEPIQRVKYSTIGGYKKQLASIREIIDFPNKLSVNSGVKAPSGILLTGPPGSGKTLIGKAIANECNRFFFLLNGPDIMSRMVGETEQNIRRIFQECETNAPSIIFIDEFDSIGASKDICQGDVERRVVSQLLLSMDGVLPRKNVVVIGATSRPDLIDPAFKRFGRLDVQIHLGDLDEIGRLETLKIHTKFMKLDTSVNLQDVATWTSGFVGSELEQLCSSAGLEAMKSRPENSYAVVHEEHFKIAFNELKSKKEKVEEGASKRREELMQIVQMLNKQISELK